MTEIITAFFEIVIWTFVPAEACLALYRMYALSDEGEKNEHSLSIRAGFWGGIILFLIVFVAQVGRFVSIGFPDAGVYQGFNTSLALVGAIVVFSLMSNKRDMPVKYRGWMVLCLTALALWTFFHYLFIHTANEYILSLALGIALGLFAHRMLNPTKHFF